MTCRIAIICTGRRGWHADEPYRFGTEVYDEATGRWHLEPRDIYAVRRGLDGPTEVRTAHTGEWVPDQDQVTKREFICPTCRRNPHRETAAWTAMLDRLRLAGASELDIRRLPF